MNSLSALDSKRLRHLHARYVRLRQTFRRRKQSFALRTSIDQFKGEECVKDWAVPEGKEEGYLPLRLVMISVGDKSCNIGFDANSCI